jgi:hypothetical protein
VRAPLLLAGLAVALALSAQGVGRGPRGTGRQGADKERAPRGASEPSRLLHWAASAARGGEFVLRRVPALLNNGAPAPHSGSGGDWPAAPR